MAKIIGTGLSGLVGTRITEILESQHQFVDLSLKTNVDILDFKSLELAFEANEDAKAVIHLAAFTDTNAAWNQKGDRGGMCYELNVLGTRNIVDLCQKYRKYLIYISTDFVFNGTKDSPYTETDPANPIDWYGQTKLLGEQEVLRSGIRASIVRIAYPYLAKYDEKVDLVRKIKSKLEAGQEVVMFSDQITTPTFIDDIATGVGLMINQQPVGIYHLVGSSSQSPFDLANIVADTFHLDKNLIKPSLLADFLKTPNARPYAVNGSLSNAKFVEEFGLKPRTLAEGILEMSRQLR